MHNVFFLFIHVIESGKWLDCSVGKTISIKGTDFKLRTWILKIKDADTVLFGGESRSLIVAMTILDMSSATQEKKSHFICSYNLNCNFRPLRGPSIILICDLGYFTYTKECLFIIGFDYAPESRYYILKKKNNINRKNSGNM